MMSMPADLGATDHVRPTMESSSGGTFIRTRIAVNKAWKVMRQPGRGARITDVLDEYKGLIVWDCQDILTT
jgi:formate-dependent phosphoribosylglycinamide formyltransferase (GAR transformylase)